MKKDLLTPLFSWLLARHPATFGRLFEATVVFWAICLSTYLPTTQSTQRISGPSNGVATILSWMPRTLLDSPTLETAMVAGVWIVGACWLLQRFLPYSAWLTAMLFTLAWALRHENMGKTIHVHHVTTNLLWLLAWWRQCTMSEYRLAKAQGNPISGNYYPEWVFQACLAWVCIFYGWAGWSKLCESGFDWANGISMQLWTRLWGDAGFFATQWVLDSRPLAFLLMSLSLALEALAPLAMIPLLRPWIGAGLIGMHLGIVTIFGWGFHGNMLYIVLLMLPVREWLETGEFHFLSLLGLPRAHRVRLAGFLRQGGPATRPS